MGTGKIALLVIAAVAGAAWVKQDALKAWWTAAAPPTPVQQRVYTSRDAEGNVQFTEKPTGRQNGTVMVDTSKIGRLEPVKPPVTAKPDPVKAAGTGSPQRSPAGPGAQAAVDPLYLQKLGKEMQQKQLEIREKQMDKVIYGE